MAESQSSFSVPEKFFDKLIESLIAGHSDDVLRYAEDETQVNLDNIRQQVYSDADEKSYIH